MSSARDCPAILAPVPFSNATLQRTALKLSRSQASALTGTGAGDSRGEGSGGAGGSTRVVYTAECVPGTLLPPWCVARLLEVLKVGPRNMINSFAQVPYA
jgi:hypothetical protein